VTTTGAALHLDDLRATVAAEQIVLPVGARTHWEVGNPPGAGVHVLAPAGIVSYDPAELTVTVGAGTTVADLADALAEAGQECPLDPRWSPATVGGTLATGLSGPRRLRYGPIRDRVLEVRFVTADGRLVKGGGPTVKNVTGYDLPRLLVGSLGTIGVLVQVTLRCQPRPRDARWGVSGADPFETRRRLFRPSCVAWDGRTTRVLLEGYADDISAEATNAGLDLLDAGDDAGAALADVPWPEGDHRGRISVRPSRVREIAPALNRVDGLLWLAEIGVGTVHVAADSPETLLAARRVAIAHDGWLLREKGAPGVDGYGAPPPNLGVLERIRGAFDPTGKLSPGRLPVAPAPSASTAA
jgi:glycolate oxidase FAD binding subunit